MSVERNTSTGLIGRVYTKFFKTATRHQCTRCGAELWQLSITSDSYTGAESEELQDEPEMTD